MKKISIIILSVLALASCQEFQPVFTFNYTNPAPAKVWDEASVTAKHGDIITISDLAKKYTQGVSWNMDEKMVIEGIVTTTDQPGNFYKSFYIQDETGGMEIKIGKNGLYNDYPQGTRVWIACKGLSLGMYGYKSGTYYGQGMVQIGASRNLDVSGNPADDYETSYIENAIVIDNHIFRGEVEALPEPVEVSESELKEHSTFVSDDNCYKNYESTQANFQKIGKLVRLNNLKYTDIIFCLLYINPNEDTSKNNAKNRVFLADESNLENYNVTTWAMSESKMKELLLSGVWDNLPNGDNTKKVGDYRGEDGQYKEFNKAAYSVSQTFAMPEGFDIAIRTSGYSKFSDLEIPDDVLDASRSIDVTGILTYYQGSLQLTVNSEKDFVYHDTQEPLYE